MKKMVFTLTLLSACFAFAQAQDRIRVPDSIRFQNLQSARDLVETTERSFQERVGNVVVITRSSRTGANETICRQYTQERTGARSYHCSDIQNPCYQNPLCE